MKKIAIANYTIPAMRKGDKFQIISESNGDVAVSGGPHGAFVMPKSMVSVLHCSELAKTLNWGTFGPEGKNPLKIVRLIDCSTDHLQKILDTQPIQDYYRETIKYIIDSRK